MDCLCDKVHIFLCEDGCFGETTANPRVGIYYIISIGGFRLVRRLVILVKADSFFLNTGPYLFDAEFFQSVTQ